MTKREGKPPSQVSMTDPQAAWVTRKGIDGPLRLFAGPLRGPIATSALP